MDPIGTSTRRRRWGSPLLQVLLDAGIWALGWLSAVTFVHGPEPTVPAHVFVGTFLATVAAQTVIGLGLGAYRWHYVYGSASEIARAAGAALITGFLVWAYLRTVGSPIPHEVPGYPAFRVALVMVVTRRAIHDVRRRLRQRSSSSVPAVVVGAGEGGQTLVRVLHNSPLGAYRPVALLDDDPVKSNLRVNGVAVRGTIAQLPAVVAATGAQAVILAIPSADTELIREVDGLANEAGLPLLVLPGVDHLFSTISVADIRPVSEADLLGRPSADIDTAAIAGYVSGKRVLVTGAGGSIGSELCRQLMRYGPAALVMLDRDETLLAEVQLSLHGHALLDDPQLVLADIRDADRVNEVFLEHRPEVVFHAAALKHLTLLERHPDEAWKTNVHGTYNVLSAARAAGVERFVNISTDKAANPVSVLGSSKRVTERLTSAEGEQAPGHFVSVRFGNVLGSRGSILPIFRAQAAAGGPLTVTDPDVTRYFMTVQEAVRLTIYAGAIGDSGEVLVLDMGQPVRILEVAERFARQQVPPLPIQVTGLRSGEKLHEELLGAGEDDVRPVHPLISQAPVPPLDIETVMAAFEAAEPRSALRLAALAGDRSDVALRTSVEPPTLEAS